MRRTEAVVEMVDTEEPRGVAVPHEVVPPDVEQLRQPTGNSP
jgi:hypothetical protein